MTKGFITKDETTHYILMKDFEKNSKNYITMQLKIIYQNFLLGCTATSLFSLET